MGESAQQKVERENRILFAAGFEPEDERNILWRKDGNWFGRTAALQKAQRIRHESNERYGSGR